jgi:hypothetical protein
MWACSDLRPDMNISTYYDIDSLVTAQVEVFDAEQPTLSKWAKIDEKKEEQTLTFDSAGWSRELTFFRQLNINEPSLVGGYSIDSTQNQVTYTPDEGLNTRVKSLSIFYEEGLPIRVEGLIYEQNEIYTTEKDIEVVLENSKIKQYSLKGYQKIILKDTARFEIRGEIK